MNNKILTIVAAILGTSEAVIPVFIHNPKSQQIEGVIFTTLNTVVSALAAAQTPATPAPTTAQGTA